MEPVFQVIYRCIVIEFYKQNAAFFGLILLIFFGFIKASEHIAIGSFLIANPATLFYLYFLWLFYVLKVVLFVIPVINKKENQFLESFYLLPLKLKITSLLPVALFLLMPIVINASFLIVLAIPEGFYLAIISVVCSLICFVVATSYLLFTKLNGHPHEKSYYQIRLFKKISKPSYWFFIEHLIRKAFVLMFLTKIYACAIIIGTSQLYKTDIFDLRLLTTGVLLACIGNVAILHKYVWFQYYQMVYFKNMPQFFMKKYTLLSLTFLILLIPEMVVLFRYYPLEAHFWDILGVLLFAFSIYNLIHGLLLLKQVDLGNFMTAIFWLVVLSTFLILFSIHPLILGILFLIISTSLIYIRQYQFEYIEK